MRKILSIFLAVVLLFGAFPATVFADAEFTTTIESTNAVVGNTFDVKIKLNNNPGIAGLTFDIGFDETLLTLSKVTYSTEMGGTAQNPQTLSSPLALVWYSGTAESEFNGTFATLTFTVSDTVKKDTVTTITIDSQKATNIDREILPMMTNNGTISIYLVRAGDIDGDSETDIRDLVCLAQYLAKWNVRVNEGALDTNGDGDVDILDLVLLAQYLARWDVEIFPKVTPVVCEHETLTEIDARAATCVSTGNIAYWVCDDCGKYFSDSTGTTEIAIESTVTAIDPENHANVVIDEAVAATKTSTGLTEGSHCDDCKKVIVKQEIVPILSPDTSPIVYKIAGTDTNLQNLIAEGKIANNPENPDAYENGKEQQIIDILDTEQYGYQFLGWYDSSEGGNRITSISKDRTGTVVLYAHWSCTSYNVVFNYDTKLEGLIDTSATKNVTYKTNESKTLPILYIDGYTFIGWSDENGNICKQIPIGSTGDKQFYANWMSQRNLAWASKGYGDPIVYEDDSTVAYCYEIGKITDVPIYNIENFGWINSSGVPETKTTEVYAEMTEELVNAYSSAVEKSTTGNSTWTFSDGWSNSLSVSEEYATEQGKSVEEIESESQSSTGNWYVNTTTGGSTTTTKVDSTDTYDLKTTTDNTKTYNTTDTTEYNNHTNVHGYEAGGSLDLNWGTEAGGSAKIDEIFEVSAKKTFGIGLSGHYDYENKTTDKTGTDTQTKTGTEVDDGEGTQTGTITNHTDTTSNTSTWSNESGYSNSETTAASKSIAEAISLSVSEKDSIGKSYIVNGEQSTTQGLASTNANKDEFSSKVSYSTKTYDKTTVTYSTGAAVTGYHRKVMAVTAYVFGVVGYDYATKSYYTYTYSVMDDDFHKFDDYSFCSSSYDDNQSGVIDFEIPSDITEHVKAKTFITDGLKVNSEGLVTEYKGTSSLVVIPDYVSVDNLDGTYSAIKVTGIAPGVFTGNENITGVVLSSYITEIPANEFQGCTELWDFYAANVTTFGENAFAGCSKLHSVTLSTDVVSIGDNAFESVGFLEVEASSAAIVESAIKSGAKEVVVSLKSIQDSLNDTELTIPEEINSFTLRGYGNSYDNLSILSNAKTTKLNRISINSTEKVPLQLYSENVSLCQVSITANGASAVIDANGSDIYIRSGEEQLDSADVETQTTISIYGEVNLVSNGVYSLFCKNAKIEEIEGVLEAKLNVTGNVVTCYDIDGADLLQVTGGEIKTVSADEYEKLIHSFKVVYDANGGNCMVTSVELYNGESIGELPVPTRDFYVFDGWYTQAQGGEIVTSESTFTTMEDVTIYAHWSPNEYTVSWNNCTGANIIVNLESSPIAGAECGTLTSGSTVHYGDVITVSYSSAGPAYYIASNGSTQITVNRNITSADIWVSTGVYSYTVTWNQGSHTSISVSRTSSPYAGAGTGQLSNGATVYYGDTLSISYGVDTGYSLGHGITSATVTGNIGGGSIYSNATVNGYTYNIYYYSTNGTYLGDSKACYNYGTTNTIYAPAISGYDTPGAQTIAWDSTTAKNIYFYYTPSAVESGVVLADGTYWTSGAGNKLTYYAKGYFQNRTSNTIEVKVREWLTLQSGAYYGYTITGVAYCNDQGAGGMKFTTGSTWSSSSSKDREVNDDSGWMTITLDGPTTNSVYISCTTKDCNRSKTWTATMTIPTY